MTKSKSVQPVNAKESSSSTFYSCRSIVSKIEASEDEDEILNFDNGDSSSILNPQSVSSDTVRFHSCISTKPKKVEEDEDKDENLSLKDSHWETMAKSKSVSSSTFHSCRSMISEIEASEDEDEILSFGDSDPSSSRNLILPAVPSDSVRFHSCISTIPKVEEDEDKDENLSLEDSHSSISQKLQLLSRNSDLRKIASTSPNSSLIFSNKNSESSDINDDKRSAELLGLRTKLSRHMSIYSKMSNLLDEPISEVNSPPQNNNNEQVHRRELRKTFRMIIESDIFRSVIVLSIIADSLITCALTTESIQGDKTLHDKLKTITFGFLLLFTCELSLHVFIRGWRFFKNNWLLFDSFVVLSSWLEMILIKERGVFVVLRVLRLTTRLPLLKNLLVSIRIVAPKLCIIALLLIIIQYVFSVLMVDMLKNKNPIYFGTLIRAYQTLFQIMTLDDWNYIIRDMKDMEEYAYIKTVVVIYIFMCCYITVPLIIAVTCRIIHVLSGKKVIREYAREKHKLDKLEIALTNLRMKEQLLMEAVENLYDELLSLKETDLELNKTLLIGPPTIIETKKKPHRRSVFKRPVSYGEVGGRSSLSRLVSSFRKERSPSDPQLWAKPKESLLSKAQKKPIVNQKARKRFAKAKIALRAGHAFLTAPVSAGRDKEKMILKKNYQKFKNAPIVKHSFDQKLATSSSR